MKQRFFYTSSRLLCCALCLSFLLSSWLGAQESHPLSSIDHSLSQENRLAKQVDRPVKNVILMISDGTSLSAVSLARWYQRTIDPKQQKLSIDPYICGTVLTYCSNAPIGDSAPTTSCYMTGVPSISGFVATYPYSAGQNDLVPLNPKKAYRPVATLMEAARIRQNRRIGVVVTCEFPHATPADCIAHSYDRKKYEWIVPQMMSGLANVVIGGGTALVSENDIKRLRSQGYRVLLDDKEELLKERPSQSNLIALFGTKDLPYDLDRDTTRIPSLAEMTNAAIEALDNPNGFMLMVEGSKVDWAAHANDPVALPTEFLAFDKAVQTAIDFARKDGNTVVIVTSDHGNSGVSIGREALKSATTASQEQLFGPLTRISRTAEGLASILKEVTVAEFASRFEEYAGFLPTDEELALLAYVDDYKHSPLSKEQRKADNRSITKKLQNYIAYLYRQHLYIGFTTYGHTGEEVFLAVYAPQQVFRPMGHITNIDLHNYMKDLLGIMPSMETLSDEYYAPYTDLFPDAESVTIKGTSSEEKELTLRYKGHDLTIRAFDREVFVDGRSVWLRTPVVYVDKLDCFFMDREILLSVE